MLVFACFRLLLGCWGGGGGAGVGGASFVLSDDVRYQAQAVLGAAVLLVVLLVLLH